MRLSLNIRNSTAAPDPDHEILERVFNALWREGFARHRELLSGPERARIELHNGVEVIAAVRTRRPQASAAALWPVRPTSWRAASSRS